jgi:hypothetical protein
MSGHGWGNRLFPARSDGHEWSCLIGLAACGACVHSVLNKDVARDRRRNDVISAVLLAAAYNVLAVGVDRRRNPVDILRRVLVHTVRRLRPLRLVLDLADVPEIDAINVGTLSAVCGLGDDHHVLVFLDNSTAGIAERLAAAGVPAPRLRRTATPV